MSNIYIWFKTELERRAFTQRVIEYNHSAVKENMLEEHSDIDGEQMLNLMEMGKTKSPYFNLYKHFFRGEIPETKQALAPYAPIEVFKNGFRSIYYLNSYMHRPGKWLVLQLRNTSNARNINNLITETIPAERLGFNVPVEEKSVSNAKLEKVTELINSIENNATNKTQSDSNQKDEVSETIYKYLTEINSTSPDLFKGDNIYLWERAALIFYVENKMDIMETCLKNQAKLQPGSSDAYLNMGILYHQKGDIAKAVESYKEGLKINPKDEDINFNISFLLSKLGDINGALHYAEIALMLNPNKELIYVLIGDIYFRINDFQNAIKYYNILLERVDKEIDPAITAGCHEKVMTCYLELVLKKEGKMNF